MRYTEFIFTQLFYTIILVAEDIEYDLIFANILDEYDRYDKSPFNVDTKGEYQCIVEYLEHYEEKITNKLKQIKT